MSQRLRFALLLAVAGCGPRPPSPGQYDERDVRGNYAITYDNKLTLRLDVGGAVREVTQTGYGGVADFGVVNGQPTTLDLAAFCAKPEVTCPSEALWAKVAVDQPDLSSSGLQLQKLVVINDTVHGLDAGVRAANIAGLIDHAQWDKYLLGLGATGASSSNCLAFSVSLAGGRFTHAGERFETTYVPRTPQGQACTLPDGGTDGGAGDAGASSDGGADAGVPCALVPVTKLIIPPDAGVSGIADGKVMVTYAGGCAFGPVLVGAALTLETGYTGVRTGPYDPPPFTPAPVVLPDGGYDGGFQP